MELITIRHVKLGNKKQAGNHKEAIKKWGEILEATSRHTDNSIFTCQNGRILTQMPVSSKK